jgi:tetratricopeptide (TPR) repeat protein
MRTKRRQAKCPHASLETPRPKAWPAILLASVGAGILLFVVYAPAIHGPLLFDDRILPFGQHQLRDAPLRAWLTGVRPMLMLTYWFNYQFGGTETFGYHLANIFLHLFNGCLVFLLFRELLPGRLWLCGFGAAVFLLHPLQTESVAYMAGRSELLVAFFLLLALLAFLRAGRAGWKWAFVVTGLCGAALLSKEQALALIPLFLVLEAGWLENPERLRPVFLDRMRRHWRLWVLLMTAGALGGALVWSVLRTSPSAGFSVAGRPPVAYFLTECRVIFQYLRLFLLPIGQNMDPHPALSYSLWDHAAALWVAAIVLLIGLAIRFRHRAPLATFGFLFFLILLAPTSSFIPLNDPMAEHRMYLPLAGLCLILLDLLSRVRISEPRIAAAITCALVFCAALTFERSQVWGSATALAEDAASRPPLTTRSVVLLAQAYLNENQPNAFLARLAASPPPGLENNPEMLTELALTLASVGRNEEAVDRLRRALSLQPDAFGFGLKGYLEGKLGRSMESLHDLNRAIELGPDFDAAYAYRGLWYLASNQLIQARDDFLRALSLNPMNSIARDGLGEVERHLAEQASQTDARHY